MNIGIIAGESFFKNSSFYIANLIVKQAVGLQHRVFIFNRTTNPVQIENTTEIAVGKFLYTQKITTLLKKNAIEKLLVFNTKDLINKAPSQILFLNEDVADMKLPEKSESNLCVITFSKEQKQELVQSNPYIEKNIFLAKTIIEKGFSALDFEKRTTAKENYAEGKEYFVCANIESSQDQFVNLLKAFSAYKKMQQSSWKLVVLLPAHYTTKEKEELLQPLTNFKFREDVKIINDASFETKAECIGGAYALISNIATTIYNPSTFEALLCNIPVISAPKFPDEKYSQIILETKSAAPEHIAEQMMALYKDETRRSRLSQKAAEIMAGFDADQNISELFDVIIKS